MTRILATIGLALTLMGCVSAGYDGYGAGNPAYNSNGNTGPYDGPKGGHGGAFGG